MSTQIHQRGEGIRTIDIGGSITIAKADGATTGDAFVVAETTLQPGGFAPPLHLHREIAEVLYLLSGHLDLHLGDDHRIVGPGTCVGIPSGIAHTMSVAGDEPDPETSGPLLAQIDMEMLAPAAS
jgi:mannose-6-phosphate isomerase-like protein (cupin superfamily)